MKPIPPARHETEKRHKMPSLPHIPYMPKYLKPHYKIKEPYFYQHLVEMRGNMVEVATTCKLLKGKLLEVLPDHLLLEMKEGLRCHVRLKEICFVCPHKDH